jgi:CRISPR-associated exonuclease Cas4
MAMDVHETGTPVGRIDNPSNVERVDNPSGGERSGRTAGPTYTGTHINYYFVCKRKLWLFAHDISMEHTSDAVMIGKLVDESTYQREEKAIDIEDAIVIDWIDERTGILHEVKKSDKMEEAHAWQVLYYLWYLKQKGVGGLKGEIDYPKLKQKTSVELTPQREEELTRILSDIGSVVDLPQPPERINKKFCKTCSYFELCWTSVG